MRLNKILIISFIGIALIVAGVGYSSITTGNVSLVGLILAIVVGIALSEMISKPIKRLTESVDAISQGRFDVRIEPSSIKEINTLATSLDRILATMKLAIKRAGSVSENKLSKSININHTNSVNNGKTKYSKVKSKSASKKKAKKHHTQIKQKTKGD